MLLNTRRHLCACSCCSFQTLHVHLLKSQKLIFTCFPKTVISLLGSWLAWWESVSFKGVLVTESSVLCPRWPIASKVIQNVRLCVMIFPDSWVARRAHVTPQISPDNTLRHTGWSHSPDLAAPANLGKERKKTFLIICSIRWKRKILQHSPPVWLPLTLNLLFFLPRPRIASLGLLESCTQNLQIQLAIMNWINTWILWRMWRISLAYLAQCCHFFFFLVVLCH